MYMEPFTRDERYNILTRYKEAHRRYDLLMDQGKYDEADIPRAEFKRLRQEYYLRLPKLVMSCCPFDGKPLVRTFDRYGLDGLWWGANSAPEELPSCPHFCVLVGAVNFVGLKPQAADFEVQPGPEVPYVFPRLLEYEGMIAVISQIKMENGYIAYPVSYFAERRPPPQDLTAGWARTMYDYTTQLGEDGFLVPNDIWDFELGPWLEAGKIRWCDPDSDNTVLSEEPPNKCPYLDLPGERKNIIVLEDRQWWKGLPDGEYLSPMD